MKPKERNISGVACISFDFATENDDAWERRVAVVDATGKFVIVKGEVLRNERYAEVILCFSNVHPRASSRGIPVGLKRSFRGYETKVLAEVRI